MVDETWVMDNIGTLCASCVTGFDTLIRSLTTCPEEHRKVMLPRAVENEYARFKIWAGNLGALQRGQSSLDARLRDAVVLRGAVIKFLSQLQDSLIKSTLKSSLKVFSMVFLSNLNGLPGTEITTGLRLPYEQEFASNQDEAGEEDDDPDDSDTSSETDAGELAERLSEIRDVMGHLYRLSFKIRNTKYRSINAK